MRPMEAIVRREFSEMVRTPIFLLVTVLGALGLLALSFVPPLLERLDDADVQEIRVIDETGWVFSQLEAALQAIPGEERPPLDWVEADGIPDRATLDQQIKEAEGEIAYLWVEPVASQAEPQFTLAHGDLAGWRIAAIPQLITPIALQARAEDLGVSPTAVAQLQEPSRLDVRNLNARFNIPEEEFSSQGLVYFLLFGLYVLLIGYGSVLSSGVAAEKGSRVVEMMLVSAKPTELLNGKLIGLGAAALLQVLVLALFGWGVYAIQVGAGVLNFEIPIELSTVPPSMLGYFVLFFLLGFYAYSALFAVSGSMASRPEEAGQTVMPVIVLMVIAYVLSVVAMNDPAGSVAVVGSLIPFITPMAMFARIALGEVPVWQIAFSVALTVAFGWAATRLSGRIYRATAIGNRGFSWLEGIRGAGKRAM